MEKLQNRAFVSFSMSRSADYVELTPETMAGWENLPPSPKRCAALRCWEWTRPNQIKLAVFLAFAVLISILLGVAKVHQKFPDLLTWLDDHRVGGSFLFIGFLAVATVLLLPAMLLALGAGYVYRLWLGSLIVWVGASCGCLAAFLLGRFVFREAVARRAARHPKFHAIDVAMGQQGWKLLLLIRLAPVVPFVLVNCECRRGLLRCSSRSLSLPDVMSATRISFAAYAVTSVTGIIPGIFLFVYFGSLVGTLSEASDGSAGPDPSTQVAVGVVSGVMLLLAVVTATVYARRAVNKALAEAEAQRADGGSNAAGAGAADADDGVSVNGQLVSRHETANATSL